MAAKKKIAETAPEAVRDKKAVEPVTETSRETAEPWPMEYAVIAPKGLNLRKKPDLEAEVLAVLPEGCGVWPVELIEDPDGWAEVCTGYLTGWVMARYLARLE